MNTPLLESAHSLPLPLLAKRTQDWQRVSHMPPELKEFKNRLTICLPAIDQFLLETTVISDHNQFYVSLSA